MYRYIENIILQDSQRNSGHQDNEVPATQKLTNVEITNDDTCCKDFTKSLCLDIKN